MCRRNAVAEICRTETRRRENYAEKHLEEINRLGLEVSAISQIYTTNPARLKR